MKHRQKKRGNRTCCQLAASRRRTDNWRWSTKQGAGARPALWRTNDNDNDHSFSPTPCTQRADLPQGPDCLDSGPCLVVEGNSLNAKMSKQSVRMCAGRRCETTSAERRQEQPLSHLHSVVPHGTHSGSPRSGCGVRFHNCN